MSTVDPSLMSGKGPPVAESGIPLDPGLLTDPLQESPAGDVVPVFT